MTEGCQVFPLANKPGVRRDGTSLESPMFRMAQWVRWHFGRARKMGGYRQITASGLDAIYTLNLYPRNEIGWTHLGSTQGVQQIQLNANTGLGSGLVNRTPSPFVPDPEFLWTFTTMYDDAVGTTAVQLLAHVAPNLVSIANATVGTLYAGDVDDPSILVAVAGAPQVAGGVCVIQPYAFLYDKDGGINWSDVNVPSAWATGDAGSDRITDKKIVFGCPARGGTVPSGLFWSLDSLIRATFVGSPAVWSFNTVASNISIMSSRCVAEYDGVFYWPGVGRFFYYDGVVRELPNPFNADFFFENINKAARQQVFQLTNQRFGEIAWCFPFGTSEVANWMIIYNVRGQYWYDSPLPDAGRASGFDGNIFWWPLMGGFDGDLWQHEYGYDKIVSGALTAVTPINAFYETSFMAFPTTGPGKDGWVGEDRWSKTLRIEPDWRSDQSGKMTLTITQQPYAMTSDPTEIIASNWDFDQGTQVKDFKKTGRLVSFKWDSNTQGGFFQQGEMLLHIGMDDGRGN